MNRFDYDIRITPSVLDRLLDDEPGASQEAPASRQKTLRQLKDAVKRDLEWLLNTRQLVGGIPPELPETCNSLAAYGLPDFTNINAKSQKDQVAMRRTIEMAISLGEPRLEDVVVTITEMKRTDLVLRFHIAAKLRVEPAPEPVTFDTVLQMGSGQYEVKETS